MNLCQWFIYYYKLKTLHVKYVIEILVEAAKELKQLKNINNINTYCSNNITVIGDLHGQLDDLLLIFYKV